MDIDYMDGYRVFTFSPTGFPDPAGLNAYLHARGFKSVWMIDPGVKVDPGYRVYDSGTAADVWVHDAFGGDYRGAVWPGDCVFPDFTRPATRAWWAGLYRDFMGQGIDGVWNDMNEPSVFNVPGKTMLRHNWHRGGGDLPAGPHAQYHNVYGMLMVRATREGIAAANPARRPFVLTRSNFLGGQRYAATWTGDNASTWEHLKMSIPMTLNLGLSGQPFNGPDLGGFSGAPNGELWAHWVAVGAFFPFCRGHSVKGAPAKEPWAFGPEVEAVARTALERRYRLLPYYYTLFRESSLDGLPIMRPVFFADPRDPALRAEDDVFLIGDDLLVVPKWAKHPNLPKGHWRSVSLVGENAGVDGFQPDLKVRSGAIIPLGKVIQSTVEKSLDPLTVLVSLDEQGRASGQLYEDDGDGYSYQDGNYLLTTYEAMQKGNEIMVTVAHSEGRRPRPPRAVVVRVLTDSGTIEAEGVDGQTLTVQTAR
jgi:alpha-glucosidase